MSEIDNTNSSLLNDDPCNNPWFLLVEARVAPPRVLRVRVVDKQLLPRDGSDVLLWWWLLVLRRLYTMYAEPQKDARPNTFDKIIVTI